MTISEYAIDCASDESILAKLDRRLGDQDGSIPRDELRWQEVST
jgi:hypothetical protein